MAVFAISYDPVEVLRTFAREHGIAYPLLSDSGSTVIERLGLLNRHLEAQQAYYGKSVTERHRGLPYPGSFLLDESGTVVERQFEQSYRVRPSGTVLLEDLLGSSLGGREVVATTRAPGVEAVAWADTTVYRPQQNQRLRIVLELEPGLHVYLPPTPGGFTPLRIELEPAEHLVSTPARLPDGVEFTVEGIDERFLVHAGRLETAVDFRIEQLRGPVELELTVDLQICSETVCHPPLRLGLSVTLEGADVLRP